MRHLRVPSAQTAHWIQRCKEHGWYAVGFGVQSLEGDRLIPLANSAPPQGDAVWQDYVLLDREATEKRIQHWTAHLEPLIQQKYGEEFPQSFEILGDVLLVKIPETMESIATEIAEAMLKQYPNVRIVCHDEGVTGDFRVRNLNMIQSRDTSLSTQTYVKEHGHRIEVDPSVAYYSARLSEQRKKTFESIQTLASKIGRPLRIVDAYAGVGPAMAYLYTDDKLTEIVHVNDLNPETIPLLERNMGRFENKRKTPGVYTISCLDARRLAIEQPQLNGTSDVLLVNLPHDGLDHLRELAPLLNPQYALVCGWTIQEKEASKAVETEISNQFESTGYAVQSCIIESVKGFSASKSMFRYECVLVSQTHR
jgi:tRNA (guanine37-N1)-methyltransferase